MIRNTKGSILVVTLGFIFVFTLLGFGVLHYAYVQNEIVEKEKASAEAFWLADGAVQMAVKRLQANTGDLILKTSPAVDTYDQQGNVKTEYDVFSEEDSCPIICSDYERTQDPALPDCEASERSMDPILCDAADRYKDPALCDDATRIPDLSDCTAEDRLEDPDGLGRCPCEVNNSCDRYCPCEYADPPCVGRCPCEYATEDPCIGRCPCEVDTSLTCVCEEGPCTPNEIGRCPCEVTNTCCVSWIVQSYGEVDYNAGIESRAIKAKVSYDTGDANIENALEAWGDVDKDASCTPWAESAGVIEGGCEQQQDFTFESVFNKPQSWFFTNATHTYEDPNNAFTDPVTGLPMPVEGITVVKLIDKGSLNITEDKQVDSNGDGLPDASLLIIDTTECEKNNIMITVGGNGVFRGIVWIIGEGQFTGTSTILGAVFVAGNEDDYTKVAGTTDIYWDPFAIREALDSFDGTLGNEQYDNGLKIISWKEIDANKTDYQ